MSVPSTAAERLPDALLDAIAQHGDVRSFPAHAILINEGDTTDSLYILLAGRLKVYVSSDDGRDMSSLALLRPSASKRPSSTRMSRGQSSQYEWIRTEPVSPSMKVALSPTTN